MTVLSGPNLPSVELPEDAEIDLEGYVEQRQQDFDPIKQVYYLTSELHGRLERSIPLKRKYLLSK